MLIVPDTSPIVDMPDALYIRNCRIDGELSELRLEPDFHGLRVRFSVWMGDFPDKSIRLFCAYYPNWDAAKAGVERWITNPQVCPEEERLVA